MSEHYKGQGVGWIHFAGIFFLVAAVFNAIAAVSILNRGELFDSSKLVVSDLKTWGWIFLVVAVVQSVTGLAVSAGCAQAGCPRSSSPCSAWWRGSWPGRSCRSGASS